jgi:uncharacterized membrane protein YeiH
MVLTLIDILDIMGVIVFAIAGSLKGLKKDLDILGVIVLGVITALGGGILRDILINIRPAIFLDERDMYFAIGASILTFIFGRKVPDYMNIIKIFDAAGLAVFTFIGAEKGLSNNLGILGVTIMGTLTGVAGGMLSDLLIAEIPFILKKEVYALLCIIGSLLFYILVKKFGFDVNIIGIITIIGIFTGRILAIYLDLHLPKKTVI